MHVHSETHMKLPLPKHQVARCNSTKLTTDGSLQSSLVRREKPVLNHIKVRFVHAEIVHALGHVPHRALAVVFLHKSDSFLSGQLPVTNFMGGVRGTTTNSELKIAEPVVETVHFVVDAGVLRVRPLRAFVVRLEAGVLAGSVVVSLRMPWEIVAEPMEFNIKDICRRII